MSDQGKSGHQEKVESDGIESPVTFTLLLVKMIPKITKHEDSHLRIEI